MNNPAYQKVTEHIMSQLEKGLIPWKNPVNKNNMIPKNLITGNEYKTTTEDGECELKKGFILRYYNVFNVDSISDLPKKYCDLIQEEKRTAPNHKISTAEKIIEGFKDCPPIRNEKGTPCYKPGLDTIAIPGIGSFDSSEAYYSTLFHECTHSTGHAKKLGRFKEEGQSFHFGCKSYANEELTAELGASFLMGEIGSELQIENSVAYIQSWLKALNSDKTLIVSASAKSEKAVNYILNRAGKEEI